MLLVSLVLATACLASSTVLAAYDKQYYNVEEAEALFDDYLIEHKKVYNREEYYERLEIFKETLRRINDKNAMYPDTVFALNHFADLKSHELQQYRGFELPADENIMKVSIPDGPSPSDHFDWRDKHAVTHVKNQQTCGSCYIFSAVGNIEGQYAIKHKQCLGFSEAQALQCLDSGTCKGGKMEYVYQELIKKKKKLEKEEDYPYLDPENHKWPCREDVKKGVVQVTKSYTFDIKDEEDLKNKLFNLGPLAIAVSSADFGEYHKGILEPDDCTGKGMDHAVLLVGYGEENGKKFWSIKNSWGVEWGEKGYVKLLRGVNACNVTGYVTSSEVA